MYANPHIPKLFKSAQNTTDIKRLALSSLVSCCMYMFIYVRLCYMYHQIRMASAIST